MRKLFGNSSRGASGGRYVAGKQAERRSAPVQPDVQRFFAHLRPFAG